MGAGGDYINFRALATGALGFTVALAWNTATADLLRGVVPERAAALLRAVVITGAVFLVALLANHLVAPATPAPATPAFANEGFHDSAPLVRLPWPRARP
jgi:hypothetical protein